MTDTPVKAWITKYLFTKGIYTVDGVVGDSTPSMLIVKRPGEITQYFHGKDWHRTNEDALVKARKMIAQKRATISKQLIALDTLEGSL